MRIKKVVKKHYDKPIPVYDLSVPSTENFCLANGCVVHNSKDCADGMAGVAYGLTMQRGVWAEFGLNPSQIPNSLQELISKQKDQREAA